MIADIEWSGLKRALLIAAVLAVVAILNVGALPVLLELYERNRIEGHWYHPAFAALCVVPAAVAHGTASHAGGRGAAWWLLWVPGVALYAAYPWPDRQGDWQALWIFVHAWDWGRAIVLNWDTAGPFVFNSFGAFVVMVVVAAVTFGRLWFGAAKAFGRAGSDVLAPGDGGKALPNAAWATRGEVAKRFSASGGIVLGELTDPVRQSRNFKPDRERSWGRQGRGQLITMSAEDGNGHVLVTSQASGYKSTGLVIPNILTYDGPLVVFDPKCELYARTRHAREAMQRTPVVIDGNNGFDPARLIAALAKDHPSAYRRMAKMVIPAGHGGIENSQYFKDAATNLFTALLAYHGEIGSTNILQNISALLAHPPKKIHSLVAQDLDKSKLAFVKNELGALKDMEMKFWYSVKTEITNQLLFGAMPDVERYITMKPGSKLPSQVIDPKCDVFLNIPQHIAEDFAPMLRLMLGSMLTAAQLVEVNEAPSARRLFLIDEAAKLGNMDILENIRDRGRSIGLHLMMVYQTPGDIERIWGRAGMTAWRDGCSATVMGPVTSRTSAQDVSAMIGTRTVRVGTESTSSSTQVMSPMGGSVSTTVQEQLRDVPLISPTALSQLPRHASIITSPGSRPIRASKAIWFTREDMKERVRSTEEIKDELDVKEKRKKATEQLEEIARTEAEQARAAGESRPSGPELATMQRRNMDDDPEDEIPEPQLSERAMARFPRIDPPCEAVAAVQDEVAPRDHGEEAEGAADGVHGASSVPPVPEGGETPVQERVGAEAAAASEAGNAGDGGEAPVPGDDADATGGAPVRALPRAEGDGEQGAGPEAEGAGLASASQEEVPAYGPPTGDETGEAAAAADGDDEAQDASTMEPEQAGEGDVRPWHVAQEPGEARSERDAREAEGVSREDGDGQARDSEAKAAREPPLPSADLAAMQRRNMNDGPDEAVPRPKLPELARATGRRVDASDKAPAGERGLDAPRHPREGAAEGNGNVGLRQAIAVEPEGASSGNGNDESRDPGTSDSAVQDADASASHCEDSETAADGVSGMEATSSDAEEGEGAAREGAVPTADSVASRPADGAGAMQESVPGPDADAAVRLADSGEAGTGKPVTGQPAETVDRDARNDVAGVAAASGNATPVAAAGESTAPAARQDDDGPGSDGREPGEASAGQDPDGAQERPSEGGDGDSGKPAARDGDRLSTNEGQRFAELVGNGMSLEEIAGELGRSVASVAAWDREQRVRGLLPGGGRDTGRKRTGPAPDGNVPGDPT